MAAGIDPRPVMAELIAVPTDAKNEQMNASGICIVW
jgi:hypothetical protein